jgi:hypothetical protein
VRSDEGRPADVADTEAVLELVVGDITLQNVDAIVNRHSPLQLP